MDTEKPATPVCFLLSKQATLGHVCDQVQTPAIQTASERMTDRTSMPQYQQGTHHPNLWVQIGAVFLHVYKILNTLCGFFPSMAAIQTKETVSVCTP